MAESDWATLLRYLYENDGVYLTEKTIEAPEMGSGEKDLQQREHLRERLLEDVELNADTPDEIKDVITHLTTTDLVERESTPKWAELSLTSKGFDVAHGRELSEQDRQINRSLVAFTLVLVLAEVVGSIPFELFRLVGALVLLVALLLYMFEHKEVLT